MHDFLALDVAVHFYFLLLLRRIIVVVLSGLLSYGFHIFYFNAICSIQYCLLRFFFLLVF
jgi:hypothetical protein